MATTERPMAPAYNLDVPSDRTAFLERYGTGKGRWLAHRLGFKGPGSARLATAVSNYAWNAETASQCRLRGDIPAAVTYETIADRIYTDSLRALGWW